MTTTMQLFNPKCKFISNAIFVGSMRMQSNLHICKDVFVQWLCLFVTFMVWFIDIYCAAVTCNHAAKNTIIPCLQANLRPVHIIGLCYKSIIVEKYRIHRRKMQILFYPGQLGRTMLHIFKPGKESSWRKKSKSKADLINCATLWWVVLYEGCSPSD